MSWDDALEGPGRDFAASNAQHIRCLAGPGTGKTYALMKRVQRLIEEEGVAPSRILVVTLTRTAADDLRRNLAELDVDGAGEVATCTLHSFCFSTLMLEDILAVTRRTPRLLATFERDVLLKDLPETLGTFTQKKDLLTQSEAAWSALDGTPLGTAPGTLPAEFQTALIESLRWHECMLVGELVPIARTYLAENPYSPALVRFDHILVDEYQDLNRADHGVIGLLAASAISRGGQIAVIGDDDQCIYVRLRHAHPRGIVEFAAEDDIPLLVCRRCPTRITAMAQNLIEHNPGRAKAPLEPRASNPPGTIHNVIFPSMNQETEGLAQYIHARIESGDVRPGEVLVLANWRVIAYRLRDRLLEMGYDAHSYFREEALDTVESKRALTLLTLLAAPDDRVALRSFIALASPNDDRAAYRRIQAHALEQSVSAASVLDALAAGSLHIPYTDHAVESFRGLRGNLAELQALTGDMEALAERLCPIGDAATHTLRGVVDRVLMVPEHREDIAAFMSAVRTQIGVPEVPLDASFIRLMSLHKSKGLTVKLVVIAGLVEGLVPRTPKGNLTGPALEEHEHEQRRILYVGITRPTAELVLSRFQEIDMHSALRSGAATGAWTGQGVKRTVSSSLLRELGPELPPVIRAEEWEY
ncbi:MAG: UvrD-helicase domain-containing protein [Thermoleophilia bacterium]